MPLPNMLTPGDSLALHDPSWSHPPDGGHGVWYGPSHSAESPCTPDLSSTCFRNLVVLAARDCCCCHPASRSYMTRLSPPASNRCECRLLAVNPIHPPWPRRRIFHSCPQIDWFPTAFSFLSAGFAFLRPRYILVTLRCDSSDIVGQSARKYKPPRAE